VPSTFTRGSGSAACALRGKRRYICAGINFNNQASGLLRYNTALYRRASAKHLSWRLQARLARLYRRGARLYAVYRAGEGGREQEGDRCSARCHLFIPACADTRAHEKRLCVPSLSPRLLRSPHLLHTATSAGSRQRPNITIKTLACQLYRAALLYAASFALLLLSPSYLILCATWYLAHHYSCNSNHAYHARAALISMFLAATTLFSAALAGGASCKLTPSVCGSYRKALACRLRRAAWPSASA